VFEQPAAEHGAERYSGGGGGRPDRQRLAALVGREDETEDRKGQWEHERGGDAEEHPGNDQHLGRRAVGAPDGGQREEHNRRDQQALVAEAIAQQAGRQHAGREHHCVRVGEPLQLGDGRVQVCGEGWLGHIEDRAVQADRQERHREQAQYPPPARI
jgi:hypothetical protein